MKPAPFRYERARSVEHATSLLAENPGARVLAGGQSLVPMMNLRLAAPPVLVDINGIPGLDRIDIGDHLSIGANARHKTIEESEPVFRVAPMLRQALRHVGHVAIRTRGTIGGSLAQADPAAELPAVLLALDGTVTTSSPDGSREIRADDLFRTLYTTSLSTAEIITEVRIPLVSGGTSVHEVSRRHGDFALAGAVAHVVSDRNGTVTAVRAAMFGVGATPVRSREAEDTLIGAHVTDSARFAAAAAKAASTVQPFADPSTPQDYRRRVAEVVLRRALCGAAERSHE